MIRLFTEIKFSNKEPKVKYYLGFPPELTDDKDQRTLLQYPSVLVIEETTDGFYLYRYTDKGDFSGETWHPSLKEAKEQAGFEYEDSMGDWREVPENVKDPVEYALSQLKKN